MEIVLKKRDTSTGLCVSFCDISCEPGDTTVGVYGFQKLGPRVRLRDLANYKVQNFDSRFSTFMKLEGTLEGSFITQP